MKKHILILCFIVHSLSIFSQEWISFAESEAVQQPLIEIISSNSEEFIFSTKIFGFIIEKVEIEDRLYDKIQLPGYKTLADVGFPALPTINELIGIPRNSTVELSILDSTWTKISGYRIMPYQESLLETERRVKYDINEDFYISSRKYPDNIFRFSEIMHWREIENRNH